MTREMSNGSNKVSAEHFARAAYLYVRQSSSYQVDHHLESKRRQYDLGADRLTFTRPSQSEVAALRSRAECVCGSRCLCLSVA